MTATSQLPTHVQAQIARGPGAGTWKLDPLHSNAQFRVRHFGISWLRGQLRDFELTLNAAEDGALDLRGSAPVDGIATRDEQLTQHLQSPEFFDASLHPSIGFASTEVVLNPDGSARVTGELTMKGVTAPLELNGEWSAPIVDLYGAQRMALELSGDIDRTAYGISWNAPLAHGGEVLGPRVRLEGDFELVRQ